MPCSFNSEEEVERPKIFECKGWMEIIYELRNSCWMGTGDDDIINVYQHKDSNARSFVNEQGRVGLGIMEFQFK
jgi:hypothetical protein